MEEKTKATPTVRYSDEELEEFKALILEYIQSLEFALMRIENKTYGICRATGRLIPKERLHCVPTTTICLEAKKKEKKKK